MTASIPSATLGRRTRWRTATPAHQATRSPAAAVLAAALEAETTAARAELARGDSKAATLLGFAGTGFSLLAAAGAAVAAHLTLIAQIGLWTSVAALAAAVAVLLGVIRPHLKPTGGTGYGFVAHAATDVHQLLAALAADHDDPRRCAAEVIALSRLALTKYKRLRAATDLMYAALAVLVATLPLGALA